MTALSDYLDTIKVLVDPPNPAESFTDVMGGGPSVAVDIEISFDAGDAVELWNYGILQFRSPLNQTVTADENRIQWDFGKKLLAFTKVPGPLWAVTLGEIEARGTSPELALRALLTTA